MPIPSTFRPPAVTSTALPADELSHVYRPGTPVVVASSLLAVALAALAGAGIAVAIGSLVSGDQISATAAMLEVILVVPFAVLLWRQSRLRLDVDPVSIRVTNYFSTFRVAWQDVRRFEARPGSLGIAAVMRDGTSVKLSAVQKPSLTAWRGAPSVADETVRELNGWLYGLRYQTTSRRGSRPAGRPDAEGDHAHHQRGDAQPVPHEEREVAPS